MILIFIALCVGALGIAAILSAIQPYGVIRESGRQMVLAARNHTRLVVWALVAFSALEIASPLTARYVRIDPRIVALTLLVVQGVVLYLLAHIAYRLHRGLIYGEWKAGLTFGRQERRMALYVLFAWALTTVIAHAPVPAPPHISPELAQAIGIALWVAAFATKVLLALVGPAASLGDPAPLRRSIASLRQEPVGILSVVVMIALMLQIVEAAFRLGTGALAGFQFLPWMCAPPLVVAFTCVFVLAEFALVIALTRTWEDIRAGDATCGAQRPLAMSGSSIRRIGAPCAGGVGHTCSPPAARDPPGSSQARIAGVA